MLIGNRSVLHKSPGRFLSGTIASGDRNNFNKPGQMTNRFQATSRLAGIRSGHLSPSSWFLPKTAGGMSSHNYALVSLSGGAAGAEGVNVSGATAVNISATALGQLVASATGSASFVVDASGAMVATISGTGEASFSISSTGTVGAFGFMAATASVNVSASVGSYAIGNMSGTTANVTDVTPATIAAAVWSAAPTVIADVRYVNAIEVDGSGTSGDPWGPL